MPHRNRLRAVTASHTNNSSGDNNRVAAPLLLVSATATAGDANLAHNKPVSSARSAAVAAAVAAAHAMLPLMALAISGYLGRTGRVPNPTTVSTLTEHPPHTHKCKGGHSNHTHTCATTQLGDGQLSTKLDS